MDNSEHKTLPINIREEKGHPAPNKNRTMDLVERHPATKDAKTSKAVEAPIQQQRTIREVSEEEDEDESIRPISLFARTNRQAHMKVVIRDAEISDDEEVP